MKNENLFTIGETAAALDITPRTLRWYEQKGLFSPHSINEESSYRYYNPVNLQEILIVLLLRDSGMTLEEIHSFTQKNESPQEKRQLLHAKIQSMEHTIETLKTHCTEKGSYDPKLIKLPKRNCFCKSFIVPEIETFIPIYHAYVAEIIINGLVLFRGYPIFCEFPPEAFVNGQLLLKDFPIKICVPIKTKTPIDGMEVFPQQNAVSLDFRGAYEDLGQGYEVIYAFMKKQKLKQSGNTQEIYFECFVEEKQKDQCLTRIIVPV